MIDDIDCPVHACGFEGRIEAVATHVSESDDDVHDWETLGYEDADDFCHETHRETGRRLQKEARESRDFGEFDAAIDELEGALHHFQRARLFTNDGSSLADQCEEVMEAIEAVESADRVQVIDSLVDRAENAVDSGDELFFEGDRTAAADDYESAVNVLEEAVELASGRAPDRIEQIEHRLRRARLRRESLDQSGLHRSIQEQVSNAREHTDSGNRAFHESEYETALAEYERARECYESLADVLDEFAFEDPTDDPAECDVCRERFDTGLDLHTNVDVPSQVCPACARFWMDGKLPSPRAIASKHRSVVENIERIREKDVGIDWTSPPDSATGDSDNGDPGHTTPDEGDMLVQLVGLYQRTGGVLTAEDLDEGTDYGYRQYVEQFGSVEEALEEAGFDVGR